MPAKSSDAVHQSVDGNSDLRLRPACSARCPDNNQHDHASVFRAGNATEVRTHQVVQAQ